MLGGVLLFVHSAHLTSAGATDLCAEGIGGKIVTVPSPEGDDEQQDRSS
jgi:hypothetical protein